MTADIGGTQGDCRHRRYRVTADIGGTHMCNRVILHYSFLYIIIVFLLPRNLP